MRLCALNRLTAQIALGILLTLTALLYIFAQVRFDHDECWSRGIMALNPDDSITKLS